MSNPDGGQAFPACDTVAADGNLISKSSPGMSLRDYFAGKAMGGFVSCQDFMNEVSRKAFYKDAVCADVARWSYMMADAMIAERVRTP